MTVVVYIVGALLVLAGAVFISMGIPIVRLEIGWSEVIGGSVAGSAGFIILALAMVVTRLEQLQRAILGLNVSAALRESFVERAPAPAESWTEQPERNFPPHPLAPVAPPAPEEEPVVEPQAAQAPVPAPVAVAFHAPSAEPAPTAPEPAPILAEPPEEEEAPAAPEPVEAEVPAEPEGSAPLAKPLPPIPPVLRTRPNFLASFLARRSAAERPAPARERPDIEPPLIPRREFEGDEPPIRTPVDLSSGWGRPEPAHHLPSGLAHEPTLPEPEPATAPEPPPAPEPERDVAVAAAEPPMVEEPVPEPVHAPEPVEQAEPAHQPEAEAAPAEPEAVDPTKPVVVGRYDAGSASYIMYSNGMIEVETDSGTHQFASMQELKAFIERRDAAKV